MEKLEHVSNFWSNVNYLKFIKYPDLTWSSLCSKAGISYTRFRFHKSKGTYPTVEELLLLSDFFEVPVEVLVRGNLFKGV